MQPKMQACSTPRSAPVSFAQMAVWRATQDDDNGQAFIRPMLYRLQGALNVAAVQQSLNEIVRRHEVLRTTFGNNNGAPAQTIQPPAPLPLLTIDLRTLPEYERETRVLQIAAEEGRRRFTLSRDLMVHVILLRLRDDEYVLALVVHDIAWDDSSTEIFLREFAALYNSLVTHGGLPSLPELPIQYADFVDHQHQCVQGNTLSEMLACATTGLAGRPDGLLLRTDRPRPPRPTFHGRRKSLLLGDETGKRLKTLAQTERISLFELLLGAFQTLLHRYTGSEYISVGSPLSYRTDETAQMLGPFVNLLPITTDLSGNPKFRELLIRVRNGVAEAYASRELPLETLVQTFNPQQGASQNALFQLVFQLQDLPRETTRLSGVEMEALDFDPGTANFELAMEVSVRREGLRCALNYNTDLFEVETIDRMLGHYRTLLDAVAIDPDLRVSELSMLTDTERRRVVTEWNDTQAEFPNLCVHHLFEEQARQTPEAVAVIHEDRRLTYRELNIRANRLAHALLSAGVGPDVIVGICLERSLDMMVGLLAILKAGGAYLPLDPAYPAERLAFMLTDSGAQVLLCHKRLVEELAPHTKTVLAIEESADIVTPRSEQNPVSPVKPDDLAYVLYTSGSTGKPKGVPIPQRALVNLLWSMRAWFDFQRDDVLLAVTTISFDIAAVDMWLPLLCGARTVIASRQTAADGRSLMNALVAERVTFMQATPSTWRLLLDAGWQGQQNLRVVCTGEAMPRELAEQLLPRTRPLWNMYGPTETTIWSTGYEITAPGRVLIGRPIYNTTTYILDPHLQPVSVGMIGELHIGGVGLARGYLNRPEFTAEKFIPDPFAGAPEARLYKTGDLARYLPDGTIECLGRTDYQVKIRGFRIELSEIEAVLSEHAAVHQVVVVACDGAFGHRSLIAYVVPVQKSTFSEEQLEAQLRSYLKQKLPDYMLPARYEFLSAMPLTTSGKVDRRALPAPGQTHAGRIKPINSPRDGLELQLLKMWEEILQTSPIGLKSDFFDDLGGDSLHAAKLLTRIEGMLGKKVSLGVLFQAPTIEDLAARLRDPNAPTQSRVSPIHAGGSKPPFFCVAAGPLFRTLAKRLEPDQPFLSLMFDDFDALATPHRLEDIAAYHVRTILDTQPHGPYFLGGWSDSGVLAYEVARQLQQQAHPVALLVLFDAETQIYAQHFSGINLLRARVHSFGQWVKINWKLLRNSERSEAARRIREGLTFRVAWMKQRFRETMYGIHPVLQTESDHANRERILAFTVANYHPGPYDGRVVLFQRAARLTGPYHDPQYGWGNLVSQLEISEIPGDHKDMFLEPNVQILAEQLGAYLSAPVAPANKRAITGYLDAIQRASLATLSFLPSWLLLGQDYMDSI